MSNYGWLAVILWAVPELVLAGFFSFGNWFLGSEDGFEQQKDNDADPYGMTNKRANNSKSNRKSFDSQLAKCASGSLRMTHLGWKNCWGRYEGFGENH